MYKQSLMTALYADYEDAARKYMEARNEDAQEAERYLSRMKTIGENLEYTRKMMDGTIGKTPLSPGQAPVAQGY